MCIKSDEKEINKLVQSEKFVSKVMQLKNGYQKRATKEQPERSAQL